MELINPGIGLIFWMTLVFGILFFILAKFIWPVILKMLKDREQSINDALNAAELAKAEINVLQSHNEALLKKANEECDLLLGNARFASEKLLDEAREKAKIEAERILEAARQNINYEKMQAIIDLKNQVATFSIEIAEKVIQQQLADKEKAKELIDSQLSKIHFN